MDGFDKAIKTLKDLPSKIEQDLKDGFERVASEHRCSVHHEPVDFEIRKKPKGPSIEITKACCQKSADEVAHKLKEFIR